MNTDPFAREPTDEEKALVEAKTKFIKAVAGGVSALLLGALATLPALAIIVWKAAL